MSTPEVFAQQFARLFVHYQDALTIREESDTNSTHDWQDVPAVDRERMVAAARLALLELESNAHLEEDRSRYFAKPGEAEWGC